uniref:Microtubule-associated tumor suppressor candidate 2 n=1 Tax=Talaromyces marneffei PM1 TaxID=1077442 RepID=A0A093X9Y4_TALMA
MSSQNLFGRIFVTVAVLTAIFTSVASSPLSKTRTDLENPTKCQNTLCGVNSSIDDECTDPSYPYFVCNYYSPSTIAGVPGMEGGLETISIFSAGKGSPLVFPLPIDHMLIMEYASDRKELSLLRYMLRPPTFTDTPIANALANQCVDRKKSS